MNTSTNINILRRVLLEAVDNIDKGNSNHTEKEIDDLIKSLTKINKGIKRISKRYACDYILHCSSSTFDNYLKLGIIPKGKHELGFKELSWSEKDFEKAVKYRFGKLN